MKLFLLLFLFLSPVIAHEQHDAELGNSSPVESIHDHLHDHDH